MCIYIVRPHASAQPNKPFNLLLPPQAVSECSMNTFLFSSYFNTWLDEVVFVECPPGFEVQGHAYRLIKALYGLKRSPKLWFRELSTFLTTLDFQPCEEDQCLFVHRKILILIFVYVDDFLIVAPRHLKHEVEALKARISSKYYVRDIKTTSSFLNIRITRNRAAKTLHLCQDSYIEKLVTEFHLVGITQGD